MIGVAAWQLTVERAMVATLERWLPDYVVGAARRYAAQGAFGWTPEQMERELRGFAELLADPTGPHQGFPFKPRGITVAKDFQDWPVNALPHIQVLSPSWAPAGGDQDGMTIKYELQPAALVGAQEADDTRLLRACYEDAILGIADQHPSLVGIAASTDIVGVGPAQFTEIDGKDEKTFQGSIAVLEVTLERVVTRIDAPIEPSSLDGNGVPEGQPTNPEVGEDGAQATLVAEAIGEP